ncbi:MAG: hypothetical protein PHU31_10730 [Anaerotignum sp.]|nr:hypothetical protein [Anaerotignum sp.]
MGIKRNREYFKMILTRMKELAKSLPEHEVVRPMGGVGDVLASKLIVEMGMYEAFIIEKH